jgi:hypothetical protein
VFQEDKDSQVFYGKDVLYNADGTSNLTKTDDVLGVQDTILESLELVTILSYDPIRRAYFSYRCKRGVVIKKINNGLHEISKTVKSLRNYLEIM